MIYYLEVKMPEEKLTMLNGKFFRSYSVNLYRKDAWLVLYTNRCNLTFSIRKLQEILTEIAFNLDPDSDTATINHNSYYNMHDELGDSIHVFILSPGKLIHRQEGRKEELVWENDIV